MPFYTLPHYKALWSQEEQDKQYWNEITIKFLEQKYNTNTMRKGFPIEIYIYIGELSHKPYFIVLTLKEKIIIGPTKKLVTSHVVGYLALLN